MLCFNKKKGLHNHIILPWPVDSCSLNWAKYTIWAVASCFIPVLDGFGFKKMHSGTKAGSLAILFQLWQCTFPMCTLRELSGKLTQAHHSHPLCSSSTHWSWQIKFLQSVSFRDFEIMTEPSFNGGKKAKLSWIIIDFKLRQTMGFRLWLTELLSYACVSRCVI